MLSEISQTVKNMCCMILFIRGFKTGKINGTMLEVRIMLPLGGE